MNASIHITGFMPSVRRWLLKPTAIFALLSGLALVVGAAAAHGTAAVGGHHAGAHAMTDGYEDMVGHVNGMLQYIYTEVGATQAQKTRLSAIVQQATTDLAPLHEKLDSGHAQVFNLLTQGVIDRAALETARVAQMSLADQASRRTMQFVADVAEVLTPVQRKALADHLSHHTN